MSYSGADARIRPAPAPRRVIRLCASNKPGVLIRVALVFARRGLNIDHLVVREASDPAFSHMTITTSGEPAAVRPVLGQLNKLVDVLHAEEHAGDDLEAAAGVLSERDAPSDC